MRTAPITGLLIAFALGVGIFCVSHAGEQQQRAVEEKPKTYQGLSATLAVASPECKFDGPLEVTITIVSADSHRLFNPFFNGLLEQPGRLLIRDRSGKVVNRLLDFHGGSRRMPGERDYVTLHSGGFVGQKLTVYPSRKGLFGESLEPGEYTMQLVLYGLLLGVSGKGAANEFVTSHRVAFRIVK